MTTLAVVTLESSAPAVVRWAARFGIEHDIDMLIILNAAQPLSTEFISDLKNVANDAHGGNINVVIHALQETGVKCSKY